MADQGKHSGRLIAVDGSRGKDTVASAKAIAAELERAGIDCAISHWDASGLFAELSTGTDGEPQVSVRTLSLVYAADLAFRLRWEIRPLLEAGGVVIAASYLDTAIAFAGSGGIDDNWLRELLRFAPLPDLRGRARERKIDRPWKQRPDRGYPEYGSMILSQRSGAATVTRKDMMARLDALKGRKLYDLTDEGVAALGKALTGSRKAAPRRSASQPRSGRK